MAENRIHIQHLHSTTATTVPDAVKTDLFDGEIGLLIKDNNEKIFFRNDGDSIVTISTDAQNNNKFSNITHEHNSLQFSPGSTKDFTQTGYKPSSSQQAVAINIPTNLSHLTNDIGTITAVTAGNGLVSGGTVNSGEKGVTLAVGAGTGIEVTADAVGINSDYQTKITNGATAYSWGNHANAGYAINTDLTALRNSVTAHTNSGDIHVTKSQKDAWDNTKSRLDTFLSGATLSGEVIDTLTEIQSYITGDKADAAKIVSDISTISGNLTTHTTTSASTSNLGHVKIVGGDLSGKTGNVVTGEAAASQHTHSQYQPKGNYLTSYTETYKGTVTGITAGTGLTGGGSKGTGATGLTLSHADTSAVDTATTFGPTSNVTGTNNTTITIPNFKVDDFGHVISAGTITYTSKDTDTKVTSVDNHYTPTSSTTKSVGATEIITSISMDAKGHVTGVNKGSYTIAKSVPSDAVFTDTHHTGMTVVTNSSTGTATASTIADGSVRLNHIENNAVRSTILLTSDAFCDVEGTAANQITFSINTGTSQTTVARGDHSHAKYENQNAFGNVKVGTTTISAKNARDTLELVTGESILLTPDASNNTVTIAVTSINCGTF